VELRKERMVIFQRMSRRKLSNSSELNMKSMS
jgi:hypothetical protein